MVSKCSSYQILTKSISREFLEYSDTVDRVSIASYIALPSWHGAVSSPHVDPDLRPVPAVSDPVSNSILHIGAPSVSTH